MSDEAVLRLVGKLVSRATTLMFSTFRDSDCNSMQNEETRSQSKEASGAPAPIPTGGEQCPVRHIFADPDNGRKSYQL